MTGGSSWHPWRVLRTLHSDVEVSCRGRLPDHIMGQQLGRNIWLCHTLTQAERRCTLTHELVHHERGPVPIERVAAAREERIVNEIAARRLITLSALVDGLRWSQHPRELAEHLWVDEPTLRTRLATLTHDENSELEQQLGIRWQAA